MTGEWLNDEKHGFGVMRWAETNEVYEGQWLHDKQSGQGKHTWANPTPAAVRGSTKQQMLNRYVGSFEDGKRNGLGTFFYADGSKYVGTWCNNEKHGKGVYTFSDGQIYQGRFDKDRMVRIVRS